MQTLMDRSHSLQNYMDNNSPTCQAAEFQKLRHQHAQLLDFNHVLIEDNNHRLVDHAELMSEVKDFHCTSQYASCCTSPGPTPLDPFKPPPPRPPPHPCITPTFPPLSPSYTGLHDIVMSQYLRLLSKSC